MRALAGSTIIVKRGKKQLDSRRISEAESSGYIDGWMRKVGCRK